MAKSFLSKSLTNPIYIQVSFGAPPFSSPLSLPASPGVYILADEEKRPLYIGKSINIKARITQHLETGAFPESKPAHFLPQTKYLILQTVDSDIAAIILEANLIKAYQPYYNAATKDDKTVSFITISNPPTYSFKILHRSDIKLKDYDSPDTQIYGPYPSATIANIILKQIRRIFGLCQNPAIRKRACFYFHIGQCPGPCAGKISLTEYAKHLTKIKNFLSGRFLYLIESLKKEINEFAKKEKFEKAQKLKYELEALQVALTSRQYKQLLILPVGGEKVLKQMVLLLKHPILKKAPIRIECYDMATLNQQNTVGAMVVLTNGQEDKSAYRKFLVKTNKLGDPHTMKHIIERRMRHGEWGRPDLIVLDGGIPQLSIAGKAIPPDIPVIALSKKRETIHFYDENGKIVNLNLPLHNSTLKLLQHIRDEAHRISTTYHKLRREKAILNL